MPANGLGRILSHLNFAIDTTFKLEPTGTALFDRLSAVVLSWDEHKLPSHRYRFGVSQHIEEAIDYMRAVIDETTGTMGANPLNGSDFSHGDICFRLL